MTGCFFNAYISSYEHLQRWLLWITEHNEAPEDVRGDTLKITGIGKYSPVLQTMGPRGYYLHFEHAGQTGKTSEFFRKRNDPVLDCILYMFEDYQVKIIEKNTDTIFEAEPGSDLWNSGIHRIFPSTPRLQEQITKARPITAITL